MQNGKLDISPNDESETDAPYSELNRAKILDSFGRECYIMNQIWRFKIGSRIQN